MAKTNKEILASQLKRSLLKKTRAEWSVAFYCLVIASAVWILAALSKHYTHTISLPVRFEYDQTYFKPESSLPKRVRIQVKGIGWRLIKHQLGLGHQQLTIKPDLAGLWQRRTINNISIFQAATAQFQDMDILYVLMDSSGIRFAPIKTRQLPLALSLNDFEFEEGKAISSPIMIHPARIEVKGTDKELSVLADTFMIQLQKRKLSDDFEEVVPLDLKPYKDLTFSQKEVLVNFKVGRLVPAIVQIPVRPSGIEAINLHCMVDERFKDSLNPDQFVLHKGNKPHHFELRTIPRLLRSIAVATMVQKHPLPNPSVFLEVKTDRLKSVIPITLVRF